MYRVDNRNEVREFLISRRALVTPEGAGLRASGRRRVPGLRRSEVAFLANVSTEYYAKIERGNLAGVSDPVLDSISEALRLNTAEREYLFRLARIASGAIEPVERRVRPQWEPPPSLANVLLAYTNGPAFVRNGRMDILAANALGRGFLDQILESPAQGNIARFVFLDDRSHTFYSDWAGIADVTVGNMRAETVHGVDNELQALISELEAASDEFARRWNRHNVHRHSTGRKGFYHHIVGELSLDYAGFALLWDQGLTLSLYAAEQGSESADRLGQLNEWVERSMPLSPA